jgi:hypothetical protein
MTSSSSSSSRGALALALCAALSLAGCRSARPPERGAPPRLALFPVQNLTGGNAPVKEITAALRAQLLTHGIVLVPDESVRRTLAAHRIRYTGGIDRDVAAALRDETGADGVIIPALELYLQEAPFRIAMTTRLVTTDPEPAIAWIGSLARSGTDTPGFLAMDVVRSMDLLRDESLEQTAIALASALQDPRPVALCPQASEVPPNRIFRSPLLSDPARRTLAILSFLNDTGRRDAGEVMTLRFLAPLVQNGTIQVIEPGVVRAELLGHRLGAFGSISLDDARVMLELLRADLVLSGTVRRFEDARGMTGAPSIDFTSWMLDRATAQLLWSSTTAGSGDDGVYFFGLGRVTTASGLACAMAKGAVGVMLEDRPALTIPRNSAGFAPPSGTSARYAQH